MERAIVIKVVSRYSKVAMPYTMKPLTAPPGGKILSLCFYLKNGARYEKKVNDKIVQHHRFTTRKHLTHKNDTNEKHKTQIYFLA